MNEHDRKGERDDFRDYEPDYEESEHPISFGTLTAIAIAFGAGFIVVLALFIIYYFNTKPKLEELGRLKLASTEIDEGLDIDKSVAELPPPGVEIIVTPRIDRVDAFGVSSPTEFGSYVPSKMLDGDPETAWSAEYIVGGDAWIKVYLREEAAVAAVSLIPGFAKTTHERYGDIFKLNHRIQDVEIEFPSGNKIKHRFDDAATLQPAGINPPEVCAEFTIRILSVYPTEKWPDICISELEVAGA